MRRAMTCVLAAALALGAAGVADANTIASSTMWFQGALTSQGGGVYTGTIAMTQGYYYVLGGPGAGIYTGGGFDVYAREGGMAYVEGVVPDSWTVGSDHDAYTHDGGSPWGTWYDPDCADWNQYSLELTADHWYLRYTSTGESPMSGLLTWHGDGTGWAAETDVGTADGPYGPNSGGGAAMWDWSCGWGIEQIPLQYGGFAVTVAGVVGTNDYRVSLTPAPEPATIALLASGVLGLVGLRRKRRVV